MRGGLVHGLDITIDNGHCIRFIIWLHYAVFHAKTSVEYKIRIQAR
jgi:hypothetical protein